MEEESTKRDGKKPLFNLTQNLLLALVAAILLLIANSALWLNRYIFDNENFTQLASQSITSESSRNAIASEIVDRSFQERSVLRSVLQDPATKLVSGLLGTRLANEVLERSVSRLQTISTSQNPESVEIYLAGIKEIIVGVSNLLQASGRFDQEERIDPASVPDRIVILDADSVPHIYSLGVVIMWLGPLSFLAASAILLITLFRNWRNSKVLSQIMTVQGAVLVLVASFALALGPLFKPTLLSGVESSNLRTVVAGIYESFVQKFNEQTLIIFGLGLVFLMAAFVNYWFRSRQT